MSKIPGVVMGCIGRKKGGGGEEGIKGPGGE